MSKRARQDGNRAEGTGEGALSLEIYAMPGHLLRRMHQASQAVFDSEIAAAGFDLTSVQYAAMAAIAARPGLGQAALASAIAFDRPTTGGVIDRLEAKGFVRREIDPDDRRSRRLFLERAGEAVLAKVTPVVRRAQDQILAGLSASEQKSFLRLLARALEAVGGARRQTAEPGNVGSPALQADRG